MNNDRIKQLKNSIKCRPNDISIRIQFAKELYRSKKTRSAITELKKLIHNNLNLTDVKLILAEWYLELNKFSEAIILIDSFETAELSPEAYTLLIKAHIGEGSWSDAQIFYQSLLINFPNQVDPEIRAAFNGF